MARPRALIRICTSVSRAACGNGARGTEAWDGQERWRGCAGLAAIQRVRAALACDPSTSPARLKTPAVVSKQRASPPATTHASTCRLEPGACPASQLPPPRLQHRPTSNTSATSCCTRPLITRLASPSAHTTTPNAMSSMLAADEHCGWGSRSTGRQGPAVLPGNRANLLGWD